MRRLAWLMLLVGVSLLSGCSDEDPAGPSVYCQTPNGDVTIVVKCPDAKVVKQ